MVAAASGEAVARAQVLVRSTQLRTYTGEDGGFEIELPSVGDAVQLVVAAAGFTTVERAVDPLEAGAGPLAIALERALLEVPGLTVTANRGNAQPGEAPVSVAVVSGDELQRRDVTSLDQALPFAQGVTFNAGQMDIRGSSGIARGVGSRVLMLVDGHRVLGGVGSGIDFGMLPVLDVERIEIVKGPHSTLFGTNAMGGVVNVITRPPVDGTRTVVRGYWGVYDTPVETSFTDERLDMQGLQIQHARRVGGADMTVMVARAEGSDGFRQNGSLQRWRVRAKTVFGADSPGPLELFLSWKRDDAEEFFTWRSPERRLEVQPVQLGDWIRSTDLVVGMTANPVVTRLLKVQLRPQLYHIRSQNHFHDNDDFHRSTRYGTDLQISRLTDGPHSFTAGAEAAYTTISSNFLEPTPTVTDLAAYVQDEIAFSERVRGAVGIRIDRHRASAVERELSVNPKVGVVFSPSERFSLRTSLSRGYRAPSVAEQYSSTTVFGFPRRPQPRASRRVGVGGRSGRDVQPRQPAVVRRRPLLERVRGADRGVRRAGPDRDLPVPQRLRGKGPRAGSGRAGRSGAREAQPAGHLPLPRCMGPHHRAAPGLQVGPQRHRHALGLGRSGRARHALPKPRRPGAGLSARRPGRRHGGRSAHERAGSAAWTSRPRSPTFFRPNTWMCRSATPAPRAALRITVTSRF